MGRIPSSQAGAARRRRTIDPSSFGLAIALALVLVLAAGNGCALLIPSSWRGRAPIPLAGPIPADAGLDEQAGPVPDPASLPDARLRELVAADHARLVELASSQTTGPHASPAAETEMRTIALRLPALQRELESRGAAGEGSRIRHPVIR